MLKMRKEGVMDEIHFGFAQWVLLLFEKHNVHFHFFIVSKYYQSVWAFDSVAKMLF